MRPPDQDFLPNPRVAQLQVAQLEGCIGMHSSNSSHLRPPAMGPPPPPPPPPDQTPHRNHPSTFAPTHNHPEKNKPQNQTTPKFVHTILNLLQLCPLIDMTPFNSPKYGFGQLTGRSPFNSPGNGFIYPSGRTPFDGLGPIDGHGSVGAGGSFDDGTNLGGPLPPLPFHNKSELQDLLLAPSQATPVSVSFKLFYEPSNEPLGAAQGTPSATPSLTLQGGHVSGAPAACPPGRRAISLSPRNIYLKYGVYIRSTLNDLCKDLPHGSAAKRSSTSTKEWGKVSNKEETVWKTMLIDWTWDEFKALTMKFIAQARGRQLIDEASGHLHKHLTLLNKAGLLKWKCIVVMHRVYGSTKGAFVSNNTEFKPFLEVVINNLASKVIICISMDDPNMKAAKKTLPKANVGSAKRTKLIEDLMAHIMKIYGCNTEGLAIRDPYDKTKSICIKHNWLFLWACALEHRAPGVEFNHLPQTADFPLEPYAILTIKEISDSPIPKDEAEEDASASTPKNGAAISQPQRSSTSPQKKGPEHRPHNAPAGPQRKQSLVGDMSSKRKFTPVRKFPNGRILPPRLIPQAKKGHTLVPPIVTGHSREDLVFLIPEPSDPASLVHEDLLGTPIAVPAGLHGPGGSNANSSGENDSVHTGRNKKPPTPERPNSQESHSGDSCIMFTANSQPNGLLHCSPARKVHHSPACVDQQFSRLNFASRRGGRGVAPGSPTRKASSSRGASTMQSASGLACPVSSLVSPSGRAFSTITAAKKAMPPTHGPRARFDTRPVSHTRQV
ncbi:hypothetical protein PCANC_08377 [Puccinia coronata f. sp. avenae]|uniref:Uncharacterized protein n=1 Tax=Puccinia coronata f. sp. avenae TaxID=200324 RepID=A0A2N5V6M8_9BASI|nr:hypothetical protein PCANC_08377 [Puccinia coronata f. sp. avenae]